MPVWLRRYLSQNSLKRHFLRALMLGLLFRLVAANLILRQARSRSWTDWRFRRG
jgi:hypothetical protein